jgi:ParB family chromosome partitioning protein
MDEGLTMADDRRRLGRGLAALLGDQEPEATVVERARLQRRVPIEYVRPNPRNPRRFFNEAELDELAASIREKGVIQPILVRPAAGQPERFEIIAGERRWRASQKAGLHEIPVLVNEFSDKEALEIAIIENVQRADLNPLEEAFGYDQLIAEFDYSQNDLAQVIGKSRSHVANTLRLLKLPAKVQAFVRDGQISAGHARALITADAPEALAERIVAQGLSVRDTEQLVQAPKTPAERKPGRPKRGKDADTEALEKGLSDTLGLLVSIDHRDPGGEIRIKYRSLEQLDDLVRRLQG